MTIETSLFAGSFDDFDLSEGLRKGLKRLGYETTKVQTAVFNHISAEQDLWFKATRARVNQWPSAPRVATTRSRQQKSKPYVWHPPELALQVATELGRLAHDSELVVAPIYGGASIRGQIDASNMVFTLWWYARPDSRSHISKSTQS